MKYPLSQILDRLSIAKLKAQRIGQRSCLEQVKFLQKDLRQNYKATDVDLDRYLKMLYDINSRIWDLQADIRRQKQRWLGLQEVGRRAIIIRRLNKIRVSIKNQIVKISNTGFKDIKMNHGSA